jgi:hypothetical protein
VAMGAKMPEIFSVIRQPPFTTGSTCCLSLCLISLSVAQMFPFFRF